VNNPELTAAARALLQREKAGILSTHSQKVPGYPFGSLMPYALDAGGAPLLLLSSLAVHTKNLTADARTSLAVADPPGTSAAAAARLTLVGDAVRLDGGEDESRALYLARHPEAAQWIQFGDFALWRLAPRAVYFVAGFGAMGWLSPADL